MISSYIFAVLLRNYFQRYYYSILIADAQFYTSLCCASFYELPCADLPPRFFLLLEMMQMNMIEQQQSMPTKQYTSISQTVMNLTDFGIRS